MGRLWGGGGLVGEDGGEEGWSEGEETVEV